MHTYTECPATDESAAHMINLIRSAARVLEGGLDAAGRPPLVENALAHGATLRVTVDLDHPPRITAYLMNGAEVIELFRVSPSMLFAVGGCGESSDKPSLQ
jgi:hypothetical protein